MHCSQSRPNIQTQPSERHIQDCLSLRLPAFQTYPAWRPSVWLADAHEAWWGVVITIHKPGAWCKTPFNDLFEVFELRTGMKRAFEGGNAIFQSNVWLLRRLMNAISPAPVNFHEMHKLDKNSELCAAARGKYDAITQLHACGKTVCLNGAISQTRRRLVFKCFAKSVWLNLCMS